MRQQRGFFGVIARQQLDDAQFAIEMAQHADQEQGRARGQSRGFDIHANHILGACLDEGMEGVVAIPRHIARLQRADHMGVSLGKCPPAAAQNFSHGLVDPQKRAHGCLDRLALRHFAEREAQPRIGCGRHHAQIAVLGRAEWGRCIAAFFVATCNGSAFGFGTFDLFFVFQIAAIERGNAFSHLVRNHTDNILSEPPIRQGVENTRRDKMGSLTDVTHIGPCVACLRSHLKIIGTYPPSLLVSSC